MFTQNSKACQDLQTLVLDREDEILAHLQSYPASVPVSSIVPIIHSQCTLCTVYVVNPLLSHNARLKRASYESMTPNILNPLGSPACANAWTILAH